MPPREVTTIGACFGSQLGATRYAVDGFEFGIDFDDLDEKSIEACVEACNVAGIPAVAVTNTLVVDLTDAFLAKFVEVRMRLRRKP